MKAKIIYGCESRGDAQSPYLFRWKLLEGKVGAVYLHRFMRSDADEHHDHPWAFVSVILWRGYIEETEVDCGLAHQYIFCDQVDVFMEESPNWVISKRQDRQNDELVRVEQIARRRVSKRVWPGMILFRRATHRHRVVLIDDKPAWTIVIRGKYVREWGFFTKYGWQRWKEYFQERGC